MNENYIDVTIAEGETGYDAVAKYIYKLFDHDAAYDDVIVRLSISHNNVEWRTFNTLVLFDTNDCEIVFEYDWWEGELFIKLYGIVPVYDVEVSGGIYPD